MSGRASSTLFAVAVLAAVALPRTAEAQDRISQAVAPLPEAERARATVLDATAFPAVVLREGSGSFTCIADDPSDDNFQAACYHESLEPYMARGRELRAEGLTSRESIERRWQEIEAGDLEMPAYAMLHQLFAEGAWTGDAASATRLTVVYVPYATAEDLGLPGGRADGPWLMFPGSPTSHIMIMRAP